MKQERTQDKWYLENTNVGTGRGFETLIVTDKIVIATMNRHTSDNKGKLIYSKEQKANAEFICKAVNSYDSLIEENKMLLEALKELVTIHCQLHRNAYTLTEIRAAKEAINKAESK